MITVQTPSIKRKDLEYVLESLMSEQLEYGTFAKKFEEKLGERIGCKYGLSVNSYYSAIDITLEAIDLQPEDEIIIPSFAPTIYLDLLLRRKVKPVIIDIDENSYFPSPEQVENAVTDKTKAFILVHNFGFAIDDAPYKELVPVLIEDITKVPGCFIGSKKVGAQADFCIMGFQSSEIITTGEGGAVFSNNRRNYQILKSITGSSHDELIQNYRISCLIPDINAAMGVSQLLSLEHRLELRKAIGQIYENSLIKSKGSCLVPKENESRYYSDFPIQVKSPLKDIIDFFKRAGIEVIRPFAKPLHQIVNLPLENFSNTEHLYLSTLLVPINSNFMKKDVMHISKNLSVIF